jgi:catechol 2,3-dioxygenase-like lactoylglutathione lyase family enzyme
MLRGARVQAVVPVSDLDRSIEFFTQKVGLDPPELDEIPGTPGATFTIGGGVLYLYQSVGAGQSRHTIAGFLVDDVEQAVAGMRQNGLAFEEYDTASVKTVNGIATLGPERAAWFKHPDGNILTVFELVRVGAAS